MTDCQCFQQLAECMCGEGGSGITETGLQIEQSPNHPHRVALCDAAYL